jgi:hypothetical protein
MMITDKQRLDFLIKGCVKLGIYFYSTFDWFEGQDPRNEIDSQIKFCEVRGKEGE